MTATGSSKKIAKNIAAKLMLDKLDEKEADQADEEEEKEKEEKEKGQVRVIGTFNIKNFLICLLSSLISPRELNQC